MRQIVLGLTVALFFAAAALAVSSVHPPAASGLVSCGIGFSDSTRTSVGFNPCSMAVGDIDQDGRVDIVTGNCSLDLSLLYGQGNGQFDSVQTLGFGDRPGVLAIGDLDEDGLRDIVVPRVEQASLAVFWGQGGRTFAVPTEILCPIGPSRVAMADLDGDGHLDLVLYTAFVEGVVVIWGDGTRDPAANSIYQLPLHPSGLAIADVDSDAIPDFVISACGDSTMYVLLGEGNRAFDPPALAMVAPGIDLCVGAVGDLNGDSVPDVAVVDLAAFNGTLTIGLGSGDGHFTPGATVAVGQSPLNAAIADFDQDGIGDVAVANVFSRDLSVIRGGTFELASVLPAGDCPEVVATADLDGDTLPDLIAMNDCDHTISTYLNTFMVKVAVVKFDPSRYQAGSTGRPVTALVSLPNGVDPLLQPSLAHLVWRGRTLGTAVAATVTDTLNGEVQLTFARSALHGLEPGEQVLTVEGCDSQGSVFRAGAGFTVLPRREQDLWQASPPGRIPVLIQIPDREQREVAARIYDCGGRLVRTVRGQIGADNLLSWDGASDSGSRAPSGIYYFQLDVGERRLGCKLAVLR